MLLVCLVSGTLWLASYMSGTDIQCQATFEKNTTSGRQMKGGISMHFFKDHRGVANVSGKMTDGDRVYTINREVGFIHDVVDIQKGIFKIKRESLRILSNDRLPEQYRHDINLDESLEGSEYLIIRKINKNTWLFSSPTAPIMLCVSQ